jgi:hypothetical protein
VNREIDKRKIRRALRIGKRNAKKTDKLQQETGIKKTGRMQEYVRAIIRELINEGLPIGSLPKCGYWIIENEKELEEVIKNLNSRTSGIDIRSKEIEDAFFRGCRKR